MYLDKAIRTDLKKDMLYFQGGIDFALILNKCLPDEIESAFAFFGNVPVEVNNINGSTLMGKVPGNILSRLTKSKFINYYRLLKYFYP